MLLHPLLRVRQLLPYSIHTQPSQGKLQPQQGALTPVLLQPLGFKQGWVRQGLMARRRWHGASQRWERCPVEAVGRWARWARCATCRS